MGPHPSLSSFWRVGGRGFCRGVNSGFFNDGLLHASPCSCPLSC